MTGKKFFLNACAGCFSEIPQEGQTHNTFDEITGHLVHVNFKTTEAGETMRLHVVDENNFYIISMFLRSRPATTFMLLAKNLDVHSAMRFKMQRRADKTGALKDFFSIHQFGNSVRWYYTEENKAELPQDKDEFRAFLRKIVEEELLPRLQRKMNPFPYHSIYKPFGSGNGLSGGYFDSFATVGRTPGPVSRYERQDRKTYGNNRPL